MNKRTIIAIAVAVILLLAGFLFYLFLTNKFYLWYKTYRTDKKDPYDFQLFEKMIGVLDKNNTVEEMSVPFSLFQKNLLKKADKSGNLFLHYGDFKSFDIENADSLVSFAKLGNTALIFDEGNNTFNYLNIINKLNGYSKVVDYTNYSDNTDDVTPVDQEPVTIVDSTSIEEPIVEEASEDTTYTEAPVYQEGVVDTLASSESTLDSVSAEPAVDTSQFQEIKGTVEKAVDDLKFYDTATVWKRDYILSSEDSCVSFYFPKAFKKTQGKLKHCFYVSFEPASVNYNYFADSLLAGDYKGKKYSKMEYLAYYKNKPFMVKYTVGKGSIILCTQPVLLTNYFLKDKEGYRFFDELFAGYNGKQIFRNTYTHFEKYSGDNKKYGPLIYILSQESLRWAVYLFLVMLVVFFVFFSKRRIAILPVLAQKENTTIEYVETISRLYQSKNANEDILEILSKNFFKFIGQKYGLKSKDVNDDFIQKLSKISGIGFDTCKSIFTDIDTFVKPKAKVSNEQLKNFYFRINNFYENCK